MVNKLPRKKSNNRIIKFKASNQLLQVPFDSRQVRGHGGGVELGRQLLGSLKQLAKVRA